MECGVWMVLVTNLMAMASLRGADLDVVDFCPAGILNVSEIWVVTSWQGGTVTFREVGISDVS